MGNQCVWCVLFQHRIVLKEYNFITPHWDLLASLKKQQFICSQSREVSDAAVKARYFTANNRQTVTCEDILVVFWLLCCVFLGPTLLRSSSAACGTRAKMSLTLLVYVLCGAKGDLCPAELSAGRGSACCPALCHTQQWTGCTPSHL